MRTAPSTSTDWRAIAIVFALGVVGSFQFGKAAISLPMIQTDLSIGLEPASWLISIFGLVGAVFGLAAGILVRRTGIVRAALVAGTLGAIGSLLGGLAPDLSRLLMTRLVESSGFLLTQVSAPALIVSYAVGSGRVLALSIWGAYMPFGQAVIYAGAPFVLEAGGWRALWFVNAGLLALVAAVAAATLRPSRDRPGRQGDEELVEGDPSRFRPPRYSVLLGSVFMIYTTQWIAMAGYLPSLYSERGLAMNEIGYLTAIVLGVNVVGNLVGGVIARRSRHRWPVLLGTSAAMGLLGLGIFVSTLPLAVSVLLAIAFSMVGGMIPSTLLIMIPEFVAATEDLPAANGTVVQMAQIGTALGPLAVGVLVARSGSWEMAGPLIATAALAGGVMALRVRRVELALVTHREPNG